MTGLDLLDPASPLARRARAARRARPAIATTPRLGIDFAGAPWTDVPWRFVVAGHPSVSGPRAGRAAPDRRGRPLDRLPRIPARSASASPRQRRSRRRDASLRPSNHRPTRSWFRGPSTKPTRSGPLLIERAGVGIGAAHDIGPAIERAARGGRLDAGQFLELADTLDAASRLQTSLADDRRPLLHGLAREIHPLPAVRSTLARSFDPTGEILDTASPRLGGLRAAVRVAYDRLRRRLDALVGSELGSALQDPIITLRNGRYVVPVKSEARSPGQGHRPRRLGQRPDALRRAPRRGRARKCVAGSTGRRAAGDRADPRRAVGADRG